MITKIYKGPQKALSFIIYHLSFSVALCLLLTSCSDFLTIYPTDKIVGQDFWKTKADVEQMVDGTYKSMLDGSIQERAIMWGAYRSDELVKRSDLSNNTLDNINAVNLLPTMGYCSWASFYHVINNCNVVLHHAPDVMDEDPEFTSSDYQTVRSQMLCLRSLCHFYLVRAFRDVPFMSQSIEDDSQVEAVPQLAPAEVLQHCIDDVEEALPYLMKSGSYGSSDWRNWGYFTRDAANALLADIYLWRAAMTHDQADYQKVVDYTERVITAKDEYYQNNFKGGVISAEDDRYHLLSAIMTPTIFEGNSRESILEWQYNGRNNANSTLRNYYYNNDDKERKNSIVMGSPIFNNADVNADTEAGQKVYRSKYDYRLWNNVYETGNAETEQLPIRKMIATGFNISQEGASKSYNRSFTDFQQNWIVYRLTDVMLMQAEALTELASGNADATTLQRAFDLVQAVNKRSLDEMAPASEQLDFANYNTKSQMELLVLSERERELCFEGKRWWDLMRYAYRHMTGTDISKPIADQATRPELYQPMLKMIVRKYGDGGLGAAVYKMKDEAYLYWPLQESETKVNLLLKQNPVWEQEKSTSKN